MTILRRLVLGLMLLRHLFLFHSLLVDTVEGAFTHSRGYNGIGGLSSRRMPYPNTCSTIPFTSTSSTSSSVCYAVKGKEKGGGVSKKAAGSKAKKTTKKSGSLEPFFMKTSKTETSTAGTTTPAKAKKTTPAQRAIQNLSKEGGAATPPKTRLLMDRPSRVTQEAKTSQPVPKPPPTSSIPSKYTDSASSSIESVDAAISNISGAYDSLVGWSDPTPRTEAEKKGLQESFLASFRPEVRTRLEATEDMSSSLLEEISSKNPFRQLYGRTAISILAKREEVSLAIIDVQGAIRDLQETVNNFIESAKTTAEDIANLPGVIASKVEESIAKISKFAQETKDFVTSIPTNVENTVNTVKAIPGQVEDKVKEVQGDIKQKTDDVQATYDNAVSTTKKTIEDVKNIPSTVENKALETKASINATVEGVIAFPGRVEAKAKETKASIDAKVEEVKSIPSKVEAKAQETRDTIEATVDALNDAATTAKVFLRLEKPQPRLKPAKTTEPEENPKESGSVVTPEAADALLGSAGKAAMWLGKGVASLTVKGAEAALDNIKAGKEEDGKDAKPSKLGSAVSKSLSEKELDKQVEEALKEAEEAIKLADGTGSSGGKI